MSNRMKRLKRAMEAGWEWARPWRIARQRQEAERRADQLSAQLKAARANHERELAKRDESLRKATQRCREIEFVRERDDRYAVMVTFHPGMMGYGAVSRDELRWVAKIVGRDVECEIAKAKFVHAPHR